MHACCDQWPVTYLLTYHWLRRKPWTAAVFLELDATWRCRRGRLTTLASNWTSMDTKNWKTSDLLLSVKATNGHWWRALPGSTWHGTTLNNMGQWSGPSWYILWRSNATYVYLSECAGGELRVETCSTLWLRRNQVTGVHPADIFYDDQAPVWLLRVRPHHSKRPSVILDATYVLDSDVWRRQNNSRYTITCRIIVHT